MEFTQEEKELMIQANDQMIAGTSAAIARETKPEGKEPLKNGLKNLMELSEKLESIIVKPEKV